MATKHLRWLLVLALAPACKGDTQKTGEDTVAPAAEEEAPPTKEAPVKVDEAAEDVAAEDRAFVLTDKGEIAQLGPEGPRPLATVAEANSCFADPHSQSIWIQSPQGIHLFDAMDGKTTLLVDTSGIDEFDFDIRFGDGKGHVGNIDDLTTMIGLVIMATKDLSVRAEVVCEGENVIEQCFSNINDDDSDLWKLRPELLEKKKRIDGLKLAGSKELAAIVDRRRFVQGRAETPEPPQVKVNSKHCEEDPEDCGTGRYLGSNHFAIVVGNSRGDFYHEDTALYDAGRKTFVDLATGNPTEDPSKAELLDIIVSPSGQQLMSYDGNWFSLAQSKPLWRAAEGSDFSACGFLPPVKTDAAKTE